MADIIDSVRSIKEQARSLRTAGQVDAAANVLQQGIVRLEESLTHGEGVASRAEQPPSPADALAVSVASELADLYGILGGTRRAQGDLRRAVAAYDAGFRYESNPRYGSRNSYNALNRLITRILLNPRSLSDPESMRAGDSSGFVDVPGDLRALLSRLKAQIESTREGDAWAAGDLALTTALNGDEADTLQALERLASYSPPPSVYEAYKVTFGALAQLDTSRKGILTRATEWLDTKAKAGA